MYESYCTIFPHREFKNLFRQKTLIPKIHTQTKLAVDLHLMVEDESIDDKKAIMFTKDNEIIKPIIGN